MGGLTTAGKLASRGAKVLVLEKYVVPGAAVGEDEAGARAVLHAVNLMVKAIILVVGVGRSTNESEASKWDSVVAMQNNASSPMPPPSNERRNQPPAGL